jgi:hypothetical protein
VGAAGERDQPGTGDTVGQPAAVLERHEPVLLTV